MSWAAVIAGGTALVSGVMGNQAAQKAKKAPDNYIPPSLGERTANTTMHDAIWDMLGKYNGSPVNAVPTTRALQGTSLGDTMGGFGGGANVSKFSGASAVAGDVANNPAWARSYDLGAKNINDKLGQAGRGIAMNSKYQKMALSVGDLQSAMNRELARIEQMNIAQGIKEQMMGMVANQFGEAMGGYFGGRRKESGQPYGYVPQPSLPAGYQSASQYLPSSGWLSNYNKAGG